MSIGELTDKSKFMLNRMSKTFKWDRFEIRRRVSSNKGEKKRHAKENHERAMLNIS